MSLQARYESLGVIARGNMGVVYRARDRQLGRLVALKRILGGESAEDRARFLREAEAMARLSHPHVVAVHAYGEEEGLPWLALELVEGETLEELVARAGPFDAERALALGEGLADALEHAHAAGVLHRDVKPANVLVREGHPYLVDFGLARLVDRESRLTATQDLVGTPAYMAPEQALGQRDRVGPASDVYGLAATLYFVLSGRAPLVGAGMLDTLRKITDEVPQPLQSGDPRLDALVARCLAKDPRERCASAGELRDALRGVAAGPEAPAPRRRPLGPWLGLVALGLLLGVALGGVALRLSGDDEAPAPPPPPSPAPALAERERSPAPAPGGDAEAELERLVSRLAATPSPTPALEERLGAKPAPPLPADARSAADLVRALAEALQPRAALELLRAAEARWPEEPELKVWTRAWLLARLGGVQEAARLFQSALELDPSRARALRNLARDAQPRPFGSDLLDLAQRYTDPRPPLSGRWTPWLGGRWLSEPGRLVARGAGFGTYNLAVALDERAPFAPREVSVDLLLNPPETPPGPERGYAGLLLGGRTDRDFFCLFVVRSPGGWPPGRSFDAARRSQGGVYPLFLRMTCQRGDEWLFPIPFVELPPQRARWIRLRARIEGSRLEVWVGEERVVAGLDLGRPLVGRFGVMKFYDAPIHYRGWRVR